MRPWQEVKKDYVLTEQLMRRAISLNPAHADALSHFGTFLGKARAPRPAPPLAAAACP
mgnify:CR=1 FL=1